MAKVFKIVGNALIVTDSVTGAVLIDNPKRDTYYNTIELTNNQKIELYDTDGKQFNGAVLGDDYLLADCQDEFFVTFTDATFRDFARTNLASSSSGGGGGGDASAANQVTGNNSLASIDAKTAPASTLSPTNSTSANLGSAGVFTGTSVDVLGYSSITVSVFANQISAVDGLQVQQSSDNVNWDFTDVFSIPISTGKTFSIPIQARYARVIYTNGATIQTVFRLQTILHAYKPRAASIRPQDARTNDNDFDEAASYAMLFNGTTWDRSRGSITNGALVDVSRIVPGTAATSLGKAEDAVAAAGDTGIFALGVRRDTLTVSASATGDYNEQAVDKYGSSLIKDQTRHKRTYSLAFTVAPAATATDIFQIVGSATTTVSINKINISGTQTTGGQTTIVLAKRSTANTGGTSTTSTMVSHDSTDAASTAVGTIYTANPTTGTLVGNIRIFSLPLGAVTATTNNIVQLDFGERGKPIVLNGVAQALVISLGGVTLAGGSINVWIEFTEE